MADSKKYDGSQWEHSLRKLNISTDTITTLPADLYADGNNATVGLVGNMAQTGTPTPQNPIQPQETGERTGNLFDKDNATIYTAQINALTDDWEYINNARSVRIPCEANTTYTISVTTSISAFRVAETASGSVPNAETPVDIIVIYSGDATSYSFTTSANAKYIIFQGARGSIDTWLSELMLNLGETALPYEPFGYKIPISSASTTTPVYLGEVESTRRIYKIVFDGTKDLTKDTDSSTSARYYYRVPESAHKGLNALYVLCTHYTVSETFILNTCRLYLGTRTNIYFTVDKNDYPTIEDYQAYLAQQYAAGTPVTVWYVLAAEETAVVNEPLMKIGDYADTVSGISIPTTAGADSFDVLTTLKPSEVDLTYHGWHDASAKEWDGSQWNE